MYCISTKKSIFTFSSKQKRAFSMYNDSKMHLAPCRTASFILFYLFRHGHKENIEKLFHDIIKKRAKKTRSNSFKMFQSFFLNATPFIGIKTRRKRRGNMIRHKLKLLDRSQCEAKAFSLLSKIIFKSTGKSKKLISSIESQLESLSNQNTTGSNSIIRGTRDEVHQSAIDSINYGWKWSKADQSDLFSRVAQG